MAWNTAGVTAVSHLWRGTAVDERAAYNITSTVEKRKRMVSVPQVRGTFGKSYPATTLSSREK